MPILRNVISLFDGISCGQLALKDAGIEVENYYASEIEKTAIQIAMKNFPSHDTTRKMSPSGATGILIGVKLIC